MDKLSKEELLALINDKPKKERKKADLTEEKRLAMLERLADMRETVKKNREAKKTIVDPIIKEKEIDSIFEKKYGTKFDKMNELLTDLNEHTKEALKIKKEKIAKRVEKAEEKKVEAAALEVKPKPVDLLFDDTPTPVRPAFPTMPTPMNPNVHRKGTTRW